jgi:2-methylcitrate dehydratase PrpD
MRCIDHPTMVKDGATWVFSTTLPLPNLATPALTDPDILQLANMIEVTEDDQANAAFPADRLAQVRISLVDGQTLESEMMTAVGDPENPISDADLHAKFTSLAAPVLGIARSTKLLETCKGL